MRIVIQRVSHASVTIDGNCKSAIGKGMLILVGIEEADGQEDIDWLCKKIVNLRIFDDENGVMNKSILEDGGEILVISQFTFHQERKPPLLHQSRKAGCIHSALRAVLQRSEQRIGQGNRYRYFRGGYESRTFKRRPCYYMYRYQEQRITD